MKRTAPPTSTDRHKPDERPWIAHIGLAGLCLLLGAGCGRQSPMDTSPEAATRSEALTQTLAPSLDPDAPVAFVNHVALTRGELDAQLDSLLNASRTLLLPEAHRADIRDQLRRDLVRRFLITQLVRQEAERLKIEISDEDRAFFRDKLQTTLPEGVSIEDHFERSPLGREYQEREFEHNMRMEILMRQELEGKAVVTASDLRAFNANQAATRAAKRQEAEALREQLAAGADFAQLARQHSACPSRSRGGLLGPVTRDQLPASVARAAFSQPLGELGAVVDSEQGMHLIQVRQRTPTTNDEALDSPGTVTFHHILLQAPRYGREAQLVRIQREKDDVLSREYLKTLYQRANIGTLYPDIVL